MAKERKERKRGKKRKSDGISRQEEDKPSVRQNKKQKVGDRNGAEKSNTKDDMFGGRLSDTFQEGVHPDNDNQGQQSDRISQQAAFGEVDQSTLDYFNSIEAAIDDTALTDAQERRLFLDNVYAEVDGKELQLAANTSCSRLLERLIHLSDDFQVRVFLDKISGHIESLCRHRFGSHVVQTILTVAASIVEREANGEIAPAPEGQETGELPTMETLVLNLCNDLQDNFTELIADSFASHVVRVILILLSGRSIAESAPTLRSRKSVAYKKKKNIRTEEITPTKHSVPKSFTSKLEELLGSLAATFDDNDLRRLSIDPIAAPVMQLIFEFETADKKDLKGGSIDRLLAGLLSSTDARPLRADFIETLLRDTTGSHTLQNLIAVLPTKGKSSPFDSFYDTYLKGRLAKLALHPMANFVVQTALERISDSSRAEQVIADLGPSFGDLVQNTREGVVRAVIDLSSRTGASQEEILEAVRNAYGCSDDMLVEYILLKATGDSYDPELVQTNYNMGGSQIIQSLLKVPTARSALHASFGAQNEQIIAAYATSPIASRALEAYFKSDVPADEKVKVVQHLKWDLALDKSGSHVIEAGWSILLQSESDLAYKVHGKLQSDLEAHRADLQRDFFGQMVLRNTLGQNGKEWGWGYHGERKVGHRSDFAPIDAKSLPSRPVSKMPTLLKRDVPKPLTKAKDKRIKKAPSKSATGGNKTAVQKRRDMFSDILAEVEQKFG